MKKKTILILLIFLLTGCQAEYNIVIDENIVKEELLIYETNMGKWSTIQGDNILTYQQYQQIYKDSPVGIYYNDQNVDAETGFSPNRTYYTIKTIEENSKKGLSLSTNFTTSKYNDSYIIRNCFKNINISNQTETISISTSKELTCMNYIDGLSKVTINITTNYKVLESNATRTNNNTYTWEIDKSNYTTSKIYIKMSKNNSNESNNDNEKKDSISNYQIMYFIILIALLLIGFIFYCIFKKNSEEKNKI